MNSATVLQLNHPTRKRERDRGREREREIDREREGERDRGRERESIVFDSECRPHSIRVHYRKMQHSADLP